MRIKIYAKQESRVWATIHHVIPVVCVVFNNALLSKWPRDSSVLIK